jgi:hypothetical protein
MKKVGFSLFVILALGILLVSPASAQLGDIDNSSFTVQNIGTGTASVAITFYNEQGTEYGPTEVPTLNSGKSNPFSLAPGASFEIYLPGISDSYLPAGRYSVVISSNEQIVAIANLIGDTGGTTFYNGSYSGFSQTATTFYMPSVFREYYNWNSLISIQNTGEGPTTVTANYTCANGATGQHKKTDLAKGASVHFDFETNPPAGIPINSQCSAVITSDREAIVAVDNQTADGGYTQSYNGFTGGANTLYVPSLFNAYYTWVSSLSISKIGAGTTTVTVTYSDGGSSTCNLTNAKPGCELYMPAKHPKIGLFAATISSPSLPVVAVVNSANPARQAQTYEAFSGGKNSVGLPTVMDGYYGWDSSFTCQNVGSIATTLNISYQGYSAQEYNTKSIATGKSVEIYQPGETFLASGYRGAVNVIGNAAGSEIVCIVNLTLAANQGKGDWSTSYSAQ